MAKRNQGSMWGNSTIKKYRTWQAQGSYNVKRGDRYFVLTNVKTGKTVVYESHEVAKQAGWKKV